MTKRTADHTTTEAHYDTDLAIANVLLADRFDAKFPDIFAIMESSGYEPGRDYEGEREQGRKWLNDALNNQWVEGITVREWAESAAESLSL